MFQRAMRASDFGHSLGAELRCAFRIEADGETDTPLKRLGQNALRERRRVGVSQQALGSRASIDRSDVVDFENGNRNFRVFTAVRLAGALGVNVAGLFSGVADWYVRPLPAPEYAPPSSANGG
jgi:DNA-binding XRE family transcriptional regulator